MKRLKRFLLILVLLTALLAVNTAAAETAPLTLPVLTETDCQWDNAGNLIGETARTLDGQPALNAYAGAF